MSEGLVLILIFAEREPVMTINSNCQDRIKLADRLLIDTDKVT